MCGLVGQIINNSNKKFLEDNILLMMNNVSHRGNDDNGIWIKEDKKLAMGHQRLAILDLSSKGHQPMESSSKRYIMTFNGEIYNHLKLRNEIKKKRQQEKVNQKNWIGNSDTETLIECIEEFGIFRAIKKCAGMFLIALLDRYENKFYLIRDRMGEKPIYWNITGEGISKKFTFASEINAIYKLPFFKEKIDKSSINLLFRYSYIPSPFSIIKNIEKLQAGYYLEIDLNNNDFVLRKPKQWFDLIKYIKSDSKKIKNNALEKTEQLLIEILKEQSKTDVKYGCLLSGGIDSSLLASMLSFHNKDTLNTYSIDFLEEGYSEGENARNVSKKIGSCHNEIRFSSDDFIDTLESYSDIFNEPFADPASIPTYILFKNISKSGIKVVISGEGADETFGGYNRYIYLEKIWGIFSKINFSNRKLILKLIDNMPDKIIKTFNKLYKYPQLEERLFKLVNRLIDSNNIVEFYQRILMEFPNSIDIFSQEAGFNLKKYSKFEDYIFNTYNSISEKDIKFKMMIIDCLTYLTDNGQAKLDRTSMSVGLEARSPFLDHRMIKLAFNLDESLKFQNNNGKYILKLLLKKYIPDYSLNKPKSGFAVPLKQWFKGPLKLWANDILNYGKENNFKNLINTNFVDKIWDDHLEGRKDNSKQIWNIIVWYLWIKDFKS